MSARIYTISHKGKKIYYSDWTNLTTVDEAIKVMNETSGFIVNLRQTGLLELINVKGSFAPPKVLNALKAINNKVKGYSKKKALVGLSFNQRIILNGINRFSETEIAGFEDIEKAKDWLIKD